MMRYGSFLLPLLWVAWGCGTRKPSPAASSKDIDTASLREIYYAAELHYLQANWKQSDSLYRHYIRSNMPPGPAYHRLACIAAKNGKYDEALFLNAKARNTDTSLEDWLWLDAELYHRKSEYKKAGDIYSAYTTKHTRAWTAYKDAARSYLSGGEWTSLLSLCNRWENAFGLMEPIVEYKERSLIVLGETEKAAEQWAALRRKYPDRQYYQYRQVRLLKDNSGTEAAKRLLDTLMKADPMDHELMALYCELNSSASSNTIPPYLLQIARAKGLSFASKWKCLEAYTGAVHPAYDSCETLLRELCVAHPNEPQALKSLGMWCLFHGKPAEAAGFLRQTLNEGKQTADLWMQYITALSLGCQSRKMVEEADTMLELYSMVPVSYKIKAAVLFTVRNTDEAIRVLDNGARFAENNSALEATRIYIQLQNGINVAKPDEVVYFEDSSVIADAVMINTEWAMSQNNTEEAEKQLNILFGNPKTRIELRFSGYIASDYWSFFQCVVQQGRLALLTGKNQQGAIALLKKYLPESPVALELTGDLYGLQSVSALACYEKALLCTEYAYKDRVSLKIKKINNR